MSLTINEKLLDNENLKPVHINLFLNLLRISEFGVVEISVTKLMELIRCSNRKQVIDYLRILQENNILEIESINGITNKYTLNSEYGIR